MKVKPWLKFEPSAWLSDPKLRSCTTSERGVLIDLICLAHRNCDYGYLGFKNDADGVRMIAKCLSIARRTLAKCIANLIDMERICIANDGEMYIKRMIQDHEYACKQSTNGEKGGNPTLKPDKTIEDKTKGDKTREPKRSYGEFNSVFLTDEEYNNLKAKYGQSKLNTAIEVLDTYIASKGAKYKSHYAVMKGNSWVWERVAESKGKTQSKPIPSIDPDVAEWEAEQRRNNERSEG